MFTFQVTNMTCGGCAKGVTRAVQSVDPQASVKVDLAQRSVSVASANDPSTIIDAVLRAGYQAALQPSEAPKPDAALTSHGP